MAVRIRLSRLGRKKRPFYRIIAVDSRAKRDGAFLDNLGTYNPLMDPPEINVNAELTLKWLRVGALPSDTVRSLLRTEGVWLRFRLEKRGYPQSQIDQMMSEWFAKRQAQVAPKLNKATKPVKEEAPEIIAETTTETASVPEPEAKTETETTEVRADTDPQSEA